MAGRKVTHYCAACGESNSGSLSCGKCGTMHSGWRTVGNFLDCVAEMHEFAATCAPRFVCWALTLPRDKPFPRCGEYAAWCARERATAFSPLTSRPESALNSAHPRDVQAYLGGGK